MRFSGFSFRLGKNTRLYFSNSKRQSQKTTAAPVQQGDTEPRVTIGGVAWRLILMFITCNWVSITYWRGDLLPFIITVILALGAVALLLWYFFSIHRMHDAWADAQRGHQPMQEEPAQPATGKDAEAATPAAEWQSKMDDMVRAEQLQAKLDVEAAVQAPRHKIVPILLELDMAPSRQQMLKDLKLKMEAVGLHGELTLQQDDNVVSVLLDDVLLGRSSTTDALWNNRCFSYIDTVDGLRIDGGGLDAYGAVRPFMVVVYLAVHSTAPGVPEAHDFNILPAARIWGARSDTVCYVSSTGTAHHALGSCSIGADWTPMFIFDAEEQGYKPCSKCFN